MQNIPLSQDELKLAIGILANVQLKAVDGSVVFDLIRKLDSFVTQTPPSEPAPKPETTQPEPTPVVEGEVAN